MAPIVGAMRAVSEAGAGGDGDMIVEGGVSRRSVKSRLNLLAGEVRRQKVAMASMVSMGDDCCCKREVCSGAVDAAAVISTANAAHDMLQRAHHERHSHSLAESLSVMKGVLPEDVTMRLRRVAKAADALRHTTRMSMERLLCDLRAAVESMRDGGLKTDSQSGVNLTLEQDGGVQAGALDASQAGGSTAASEPEQEQCMVRDNVGSVFFDLYGDERCDGCTQTELESGSRVHELSTNMVQTELSFPLWHASAVVANDGTQALSIGSYWLALERIEAHSLCHQRVQLLLSQLEYHAVENDDAHHVDAVCPFEGDITANWLQDLQTAQSKAVMAISAAQKELERLSSLPVDAPFSHAGELGVMTATIAAFTAWRSEDPRQEVEVANAAHVGRVEIRATAAACSVEACGSVALTAQEVEASRTAARQAWLRAAHDWTRKLIAGFKVSCVQRKLGMLKAAVSLLDLQCAQEAMKEYSPSTMSYEQFGALMRRECGVMEVFFDRWKATCFRACPLVQAASGANCA